MLCCAVVLCPRGWRGLGFQLEPGWMDGFEGSRGTHCSTGLGTEGLMGVSGWSRPCACVLLA